MIEVLFVGLWWSAVRGDFERGDGWTAVSFRVKLILERER